MNGIRIRECVIALRAFTDCSGGHRERDPKRASTEISASAGVAGEEGVSAVHRRGRLCEWQSAFEFCC